MSKQLDYNVDRRDGVALIQPVGRLDSSQIARFEEVVMGQVQTGRHDVVLDFEQLTFLSSSALRILLGAARQAKKKNNAFLLCALKPHITDLMKTAGFDRLLTIHATREEAMRTTAKRRAAHTDEAEPADETQAATDANAGTTSVQQKPATAHTAATMPEMDQGPFQPRWSSFRWHLVVDAALAVTICATWMLYNETIGWNDIGTIFLVLTISDMLVSFGPGRLRRFFNTIFNAIFE